MRIALTPAVAAAVVAAVPAAPSAAQEGVHVDPRSPAGKEYALPLEQARREASGRKGSSTAPGTARPGRAALFGEGVEARPSGPGGAAGKAGDGGGSGGKGGERRERRSPRSRAAARLNTPAGTAGRSLALTDAAIVLAVLMAAGAAGLVLRRALR